MRIKTKKRFLLVAGLLYLFLAGASTVRSSNRVTLGRVETRLTESPLSGSDKSSIVSPLAQSKRSATTPVRLAEFSSEDLQQAADDLRRFTLGGRGIPKVEPFEYLGAFPRAEFLAELDEHEEFFATSLTIPMPVLVANAFRKEDLTDAELTIALRQTRAIREVYKKRSNNALNNNSESTH